MMNELKRDGIRRISPLLIANPILIFIFLLFTAGATSAQSQCDRCGYVVYEGQWVDNEMDNDFSLWEHYLYYAAPFGVSKEEFHSMNWRIWVLAERGQLQWQARYLIQVPLAGAKRDPIFRIDLCRAFPDIVSDSLRIRPRGEVSMGGSGIPQCLPRTGNR